MNTEPESTAPATSRGKLARRAIVLQLKLIADGMRDAALIPISFVAAIIGLIRGGDHADREFNEIIKLGRRTERWIDLFDHHRPLDRSHPAGSLDTIIDRVEDVVREQYQKGTATREARDAINSALESINPDPARPDAGDRSPGSTDTR